MIFFLQVLVVSKELVRLISTIVMHTIVQHLNLQKSDSKIAINFQLVTVKF